MSWKEYFKTIRLEKDKWLQIAKKTGEPFYLFDKKLARNNIETFKNEFKKNRLPIEIYYAIKANYYPGLLRTVVEEGGHLDASSDREFLLALRAKPKKIVFTGPGKRRTDFELIIKNSHITNVNLESFRELRELGTMAKQKRKTIRCGLRVVTSQQDGWTKFGLPLENLAAFYVEAQKFSYLKFCGIHFHISMNKTPDPYVKTFKEIAEYCRKNFTEKERASFEYIDMGGGYYPNAFEGVYTWNQERLDKDIKPFLKKILADKVKPRFVPVEICPFGKVVSEISKSWKKNIVPTLQNAQLYCEPGRFIANDVMHIVMRIIDIKHPQMAIMDASGNMIGWEKYQYYNYAPIFNLSQFDLKREIPFVTYGSLCTPDDIWGYYLYTKGKPREGDILCMPFQGSYSYTFAQEFIKSIPKVVDL